MRPEVRVTPRLRGVPGAVLILLAVIAGCAGSGSTAGPSPAGDAYPMYADANGDGVNDYVQAGTHDPGFAGGHAYVDADRDGICDRAQDGGATWHGPGFVDADGDGICDRWEPGTPLYGQAGGMQYRDDDHNGVNDYFQAGRHGQVGHAYVDADHDGICDRAEDGTASWHGPGFVDANGDGVCDTWQPGGMGYGHPGGHGPMHRGGRRW